MPKNKDLKRLARTRMKKTGESYTTARSRLLEKNESGSAQPEHGYATLAGMSDEAVLAKTGCDWERWVCWLDKKGAGAMRHKEIAKLIDDQFDFGGWWAQTVTVGYERIKGLREIGQRRDGSFEANKSKTFPVPLETLYKAFSSKRRRGRWLPEPGLSIRKATPERSVRMTWKDGSSVECYFTAKGDSKSQVAVQHRKLRRKPDVARMKQFWEERLAALAELLAPHSARAK